jgi:hypothetical protein
MKSFLTALFAILLLSANGQRTMGSIDLQLSFPQGEYKLAYPKTGVGIRFNVLHRIAEESPLSVGGEFGFLVVGSDSRLFDMYYGGYYDTYKISASNNVMNLAFKARADLVPPDRPILIFIEATVGANLFYSTANIQRETYFGNSQYVAGDNSKGYWAFTWGPGVGLEFPVDKRKQVAIVAKASYLFGGNTTYLTDPTIDNNGDIYFTQHQSKTDMILAEFGVRLTFGRKR